MINKNNLVIGYTEYPTQTTPELPDWDWPPPPAPYPPTVPPPEPLAYPPFPPPPRVSVPAGVIDVNAEVDPPFAPEPFEPVPPPPMQF